MKCPQCKSDNFHVVEFDPMLMSCDDCHATASVSWASGYWHGFCDGERETKEELTKETGK